MFDSADETALLATESRALAIGLSALLLSIPPINRVVSISDIATLPDAIEKNEPLLIIIDTAIVTNRLPETARRVRRQAPNSLHVLLSGDTAEFREITCLADVTAVMMGTNPRRLARELELLIKEHEAV